MKLPLRFALAPFLTLAILLGLAGSAATQPPPPGLNPRAPTLQPVLPLGMQRGTSLEVTLTGTNLANPTGVWTSFPAKVTIPTDANNGKDNAKLRVRLEVPKGAPLGFHSIRLATKQGMSNLRLFCIDDLPQVLENNTNHSLKTAQAVPVPCVVVGRADNEVTDYFKITVKANQRVSFEILGRRLGSVFDPELTLHDAGTGRELPGGYSNDAPGLQTDARLTYTFKNAGDVIIAVRDVTYKGGADFHYRLRIGDFPCATTPLPMAAKRGTKATIRFAGPTVDGVAPVEVNIPADPGLHAIQVAPRGTSGLYGWPVSLAISDLEEHLEKEPNNEAAKANRIPVPGAITGRFEEKEDVDHFVFAAMKGKRYIIEAHTFELGSPTEVDMVLRNDKGAQLQATNPAAAPRLDFTAPADGDYTLVLKHLHSWHGPDEVYRITVTPYQPEFRLALALDRHDVPPGGTISLPILLTRASYNGPVEVSVVGPKGLSGQVTIPAGPPKPPNVPSGILPLAAAADLPSGPLVFQIQGKAMIEGKPVVEFASVRTIISQGLANLPVPPRQMLTQLAVAITEKPPFTLAAKLDSPSMRGKPAPLTITATRVPGFTAPIALTVAGLPPNVAPAVNATIPAGSNEVKLELKVNPKAPAGSFLLTITGISKHMGVDFVVRAPAVSLVVGKK
jgi:hypothetical protein